MSNTYGPIVTPLENIEIQNDAWLWPSRIPLGTITTLVGYGGEGKSFLACSIASTVSRGKPFADGAPAPLGTTIMMAGEDLPSKLRLRYEANGADLANVKLLEGQRIYTRSGVTETTVTLRDIDQIRAAVEQNPSSAPPVKLLIVDPIGDFIPGVNSDKDNEARAEGIPARTLRYAKLKLGVTHTRLAARGAYVWQSPEALRSSNRHCHQLPPLPTSTRACQRCHHCHQPPTQTIHPLPKDA